jgi:hypothetical protein
VPRKNLAAMPKKVREPQEAAAARALRPEGPRNNVIRLASRTSSRLGGSAGPRSLRTPLKTQ